MPKAVSRLLGVGENGKVLDAETFWAIAVSHQKTDANGVPNEWGDRSP